MPCFFYLAVNRRVSRAATIVRPSEQSTRGSIGSVPPNTNGEDDTLRVGSVNRAGENAAGAITVGTIDLSGLTLALESAAAGSAVMRRKEILRPWSGRWHDW